MVDSIVATGQPTVKDVIIFSFCTYNCNGAQKAQIAEFERELTRERTKLAHERAKKEGRHWGRPKGKKDSKPRCKSGYYERWSKQGKKVTP